MNELVKFDQVKADMAAFKKENENLVFDYEDPQGNKDARSHIFKLRKIKTVIADIHKETKAVALGVCKLLDREKRELTGEVDEWIDVHYKPVKEIEEREAKAAAVKANDERLERIRVEAERAAETEKREDELVARETAAKEKEDALVREQEKLETAKQAEIDKGIAVKESQEQAERDKVEAATKAEQDKKDAAERAERDKQAAIEAEQEKTRQETQRIKDEAAKIAADLVAEEACIKAEALAKQKRETKIEAERVADQRHRANIETEIYEYLCTLMARDGDPVADIVTAMSENEIPHVTINY